MQAPLNILAAIAPFLQPAATVGSPPTGDFAQLLANMGPRGTPAATAASSTVKVTTAPIALLAGTPEVPVSAVPRPRPLPLGGEETSAAALRGSPATPMLGPTMATDLRLTGAPVDPGAGMHVVADTATGDLTDRIAASGNLAPTAAVADPLAAVPLETFAAPAPVLIAQVEPPSSSQPQRATQAATSHMEGDPTAAMPAPTATGVMAQVVAGRPPADRAMPAGTVEVVLDEKLVAAPVAVGATEPATLVAASQPVLGAVLSTAAPGSKMPGRERAALPAGESAPVLANAGEAALQDDRLRSPALAPTPIRTVPAASGVAPEAGSATSPTATMTPNAPASADAAPTPTSPATTTAGAGAETWSTTGFERLWTDPGRPMPSAMPQPTLGERGPMVDATPEDVAVHIGRAAAGRESQLQIRLQPAELGRVDVRLEFDGENGVRVHIRAEDPGALDLLQRHGHQLERALQQSGLDLGRDGIRYDLDPHGGQEARPGPRDGNRQDGTQGRVPPHAEDVPDDEALPTDARTTSLGDRVLDVHA